MDVYIDRIKEEVVKILENLVFEGNKSKVEQVEDRLGNILEKALVSTDLMDYWINVKVMDDKKTLDTTFDVHIGLQEGEHDDTKIYNIDCVVK